MAVLARGDQSPVAPPIEHSILYGCICELLDGSQPHHRDGLIVPAMLISDGNMCFHRSWYAMPECLEMAGYIKVSMKAHGTQQPLVLLLILVILLKP